MKDDTFESGATVKSLRSDKHRQPSPACWMTWATHVNLQRMRMEVDPYEKVDDAAVLPM